jgi:hypothetical protein
VPTNGGRTMPAFLKFKRNFHLDLRKAGNV